MDKLLASQRHTFYVLLRVVAGLPFSVHGFQKMFGVLGRAEPGQNESEQGLSRGCAASHRRCGTR